MATIEKTNQIAEQFKSIIEALGEDPKRQGLMSTPERAAKSLQYLTRGYQEDLNTLINGALFESEMDEMVIVKRSSCIPV